MTHWFTYNSAGLWCGWCHEMMFAPWHNEYKAYEQVGMKPECCPECGGDEEGPA